MRKVMTSGRPPANRPTSRTRPTDNRPPTTRSLPPTRTLASGTTRTPLSDTPHTPLAETPRTPLTNPTRTPLTNPTRPPLPDTPRAAVPGTPRVPAQTPRRPIPQPHPTGLFAERLLAVLTGRRPVHAMLRHTLGDAYDDLARLAEHGPLRTRGTTPVLRDIGYEFPRPGAIEAFARITTGSRLRAMAFRLELGPDQRWRCTAVELDGPRGEVTRDA